MNLDTLMIWVIVGAIAGILIDLVWGDMKIGIVGAIVIGILGSNIGGRVFTKFDLNIFTGWEDAILKPFIGAIGFLVVIGFLHRDLP